MTFRIVILAAGKGKRMKQEGPKAMTLIGGKPILQYLVESVEVSDIGGQPIVVIAPEMPNLCDAFEKACAYAVQDKQLGTGHAVMSAKRAIGKADAVIVLYGDHPFISADAIRRLAARHELRANTVTIMTTTVPDFDGWRGAFLHWGRIVRGAEGHIAGIPQYKDATEEQKAIHELDPALYCFNTSWLWKHIETLKNENAQGEYYLTDLIAMAVAQGEKISSLEIAPEEAMGINTVEEREIAEKLLKKE